MLRVTYESGEASVPAPVPENAQMASATTGSTAFLWMVWGHRPNTDLPVYQPEEISASLIEQQEGRVFYIDYDGIYVGVSSWKSARRSCLPLSSPLVKPATS